jgi:hypothetical protein
MGRRPWLPVLGEGTEVADSGPSSTPELLKLARFGVGKVIKFSGGFELKPRKM